MLPDYSAVPSPCFVLDERRLISNLEIIQSVAKEADVEIILTFKGFAMWSAFPMVRKYIQGATASSLNEVLLSVREMKAAPHTYLVAYPENDFDEINRHSSHLTFNSLRQYQQFEDRLREDVSYGLRINPEWSDVKTDLYNPASSTSRLGITAKELPDNLPDRIEGFHFHVLCESSADSLEKVLESVEDRFGRYLSRLKWLNMGGGHLLTHKNYDRKKLIALLKSFRSKWNLDVILEPGAAFAWQTGELVSTVLDIVQNGGVQTAILDASFTAHMPDTLEMPYRPEIIGAHRNKKAEGFAYRLGGQSCLAGDFLDEYFFDQSLDVGDRVVFRDMMHYTMVKTTMFNGVKHPSIGIWREEGFQLIREFNFEDFRNKLS